jgi:YD repeat-containing protein
LKGEWIYRVLLLVSVTKGTRTAMEYDEFGRKLSRMLILSLHNVLLISSE